METILFNNKGIEAAQSTTSVNTNGPLVIAASEVVGVSKGLIPQLLEVHLRSTIYPIALCYHDKPSRDQDYLALRTLLNPTNILAAVNTNMLEKAFEAAEKTRGKTLNLQRTVKKETENVRRDKTSE